MNCPVCPRTDIPEDALACPNCGSDLGPLVRVRSLPASYVDDARRLLAAGEPAKARDALVCALKLDPEQAEARRMLDEAFPPERTRVVDTSGRLPWGLILGVAVTLCACLLALYRWLQS